MPGPLALIGPGLKMLASQGVKQAAVQTAKGAAKNAVKNKAKNFVTGKGKKKGKKGKGGALVKSGDRQGSGGGGGGGSIVATTPMVGNYRVEQPPQKPDEVGKPTKVSYETINNQLDSIIGLTSVLKKTSAAKMQTAINRRKAERKAAEKEKKRLRESLLEAGKGAAGMIGGALAPITKAFDPLKFFTNILFGSLLMWILTNGSKITAFLKMTLALFNNAGNLLRFGLKGLGKAFRAGLKLIGKLGSPIIKAGRALKKVFSKVGPKIGKAFGKLGRGLVNFGLGILNRIKDGGRALLNLPGKAVNALKGALGGGKANKGKFSPNKGLNKLLGEGGSTRAAGTASRSAGKMSNATRSIRLKHGDEAARMYQGMIDNGVKPSRASKYVTEAISKGKLTSQPLQGLARQTGGSQLLKGGVGRSTNRIIAKVGGKNALKMTKALKGALGRIPIVGPLITLIVSLLDPEVGVSQALFRTAGAVVGGFLGTFIPIPVVGTLMGEIIGEYVGDLTYIAMNGGGVEAVGAKMKEDIEGVLKVGEAALAWAGDGFSRLYEGLPRINLFGYKGLVNFPSLLLNPLQVIPTVYKAFFTREPMEKGKEEDKGGAPQSNNVTNISDVTRDTTGKRVGDFIMASNGSLGVWDGRGTRGPTPKERQLYADGATNVDGTGARATLESRAFKASGGYYSKETRGFLGKTEEEARQKLGLTQVVSPQTAMLSTQGGGSDFWTLVAVAAMEDSDGQARADVAQSIYNRKASGAYGGGTIRELIIADKQFQPTWDYPSKNPQGMKANPEWLSIVDANSAASATGKDVQFIQQAAADIQNKQYQEEAKRFVGGRTDFTNYPKTSRKEQVVRSNNTPNNYFGYDWNYTGGTVASMPSFNTTATTPPPLAPQPQAPLVPGITPQTTPSVQVPPAATAPSGTGLTNIVPVENLQSIGAGTGEVGMTSGRGMRWGRMHRGVDIGTSGKKGYYVAFKLSGKVSDVGTFSGYGETVVLTCGDKDFLFAHLAKGSIRVKKGQAYNGEIIGEIGNTGAGTGEHLHFEASPAGTGGYQQDEDPMPYVKYITIGKMGDGSPIGTNNPATMSIQDPSSSAPGVTPVPSVQVPPSLATIPTQPGASQIPGISQNLSYQLPGGQQVIMMQSPGGQQLGGVVGGGQGSIVMMGSQEVLNSYHKSQILGFLYKQG